MLHKEVGEGKNISLYTGLAVMGSAAGAKMLSKKAQRMINAEAPTKDNKASDAP